ncbi:MAG: hypothetical protein JJ975_09360 [Bacteroidia bacterium]|nr:hypothetical protein [Bacteroidia bacterium]
MAQVNLGGGLKLSGNTTLQYLYSANKSINNGFGAPKRPTHFPQFMGRLSLDYKNKLRIPISLVLNPIMQFNGGINTPMEGPSSLNIFQYLSHPSNQVYVNPTYKGITFHLGHFVQFYSKLSVGDMKVFGVGAEYKHNNMSFAVQRGVLQPRVLNVAFNFNNGAYQRSLTAFRWQVKPNKKLDVGVNLALTGDRESSLDETPLFTRPEKTAVLSAQSKYKLDKNTQFQLEVSSSSYAPDATLADTLREFGIGQVFIPNTTIFGGTALELSGSTRKKNYRVNGRVGYRSRNFRTLAYPFLQSDMFEIEANPQFTSFKKKLQTSATLGYKTSNVSKASGRSLRIPIAKISSNYRVNSAISVNGIYAFNAVSSSEDTLLPEIRSSNHVIRLLPSYRLNFNKLKNVFSLILGLNQYANNSSALLAPTKTSTQNLGLIYRGVYEKHSAGLSFNSLNTRLNGTTLFRYNSITFSARTKALSNKLAPFVRYTYTGVRNTTTKTGSKLVGQLGGQYTVSKKMTASLGASIQYHKQGIGQNVPGYREFVVRTGISYRL